MFDYSTYHVTLQFIKEKNKILTSKQGSALVHWSKYTAEGKGYPILFQTEVPSMPRRLTSPTKMKGSHPL